MVNLTAIFMALLPTLAGFTASKFTRSSVETWYPKLKKPPLQPPKIAFPVVWTLLYIVMGISAYQIWNSLGSTSHPAKTFFLIQMLLNFLWSFFFFYFKHPTLAMLDITALWVVIVLWIRAAYSLDPWTGLLQIPYLLWVTFASYLNAGIVYLN